MKDKSKLALQRTILILGIFIGIMLLTAVYFYGNLVAIFLIIPHFLNHLGGFGLGPYISWVAIIPVSFYLYYAVRHLMSFRKKNRDIGLYMIVGFVMVWCLAMAFVTKDHLFDPNTGEPLYSFFHTVNGNVKLHPTLGKFDPKTGRPINPLTPEKIDAMEILENGVPKVEHLQVNKDSQFFRIDGGTPLLYYTEYTDGRIEFFAQKGMHPQTGEPLLPVTKEIVDKFFNYIVTNRTNLIVGYTTGSTYVQKQTSNPSTSIKDFSKDNKSLFTENNEVLSLEPKSGLRALSETYKQL